MIIDYTFGKLEQIREFATQNNLIAEFESVFKRFNRFSDQGYRVDLFSDFAPQSLYFELYWEGEFSMNGGMIFHGPHDGGGNGSAPTFSVSINPDSKPHWSIHT